MKHYRGRAALIVAMATMLTVTLVASASAGVPSGEPYGCNDSTSTYWQANCWVSSYSNDPDKVSDFTTGIQRIVREDYPLGSVDGWYGTNTRNAVKQWQQSRGLQVDGIVGTNTWAGLRSELYSKGTAGGYHQYSVGSSGNAATFQQQTSGSYYWQVRSGWTYGWRWMDRTRNK